MGRVGLVSLVVLAAACSADADPGSALRNSDIWTAMDDELPLLDSSEWSPPGSVEHGCVSITEVHELEGPDERVFDQLEHVAVDEGWEVRSRHAIAGSAEGTIDGPAPQMIVERPMGETTLHAAFLVSQHPGYEGRWTLVTQGDCRDTDPFATARQRSQD